MDEKFPVLFECKSCGYQDYMGNTKSCPVCEPEKSEEESICFFLNVDTEMCRQDGKKCPFIDDKDWQTCEKLEHYNPGLGREK